MASTVPARRSYTGGSLAVEINEAFNWVDVEKGVRRTPLRSRMSAPTEQEAGSS